MKINLLSFGITKDITGSRFQAWELDQGATVGELRQSLYRRFPHLAKLTSLSVAVNNEYANDEHTLHANDEVALIPPVSGG